MAEASPPPAKQPFQLSAESLEYKHLLPRSSMANLPKPLSSDRVKNDTPLSRKAHFAQYWWLELAACLLSVVALFAVIVTLSPHAGKPIPQWPHDVSINSMISIYIVVLKATVLMVIAQGLGQLKWRWFRNDRSLEDIDKFDSATRGPLGSLSLIWRLGYQHPLSSFGALVTVLMLGIDPLAQQIIRYYSCSLAVDGVLATVPRTNLYVGKGHHVGAGQISITSDLQFAINAGIFSPGNLVAPGCPTRNCSFPKSYSTVAFCGGCQDTTESLNFRRLPSADNSVSSWLPSGVQINTTVAFDPEMTNFATMETSILHGAEFIFIKNPRILQKWSEIKSPNLNITCLDPNEIWNCLGYGAASCGIYPCVRTYNSTIQAGVFEESLISTSSDRRLDDGGVFGGNDHPLLQYPLYVMSTVDTECISPTERSSLITAGYHIDSNVRWLPYNMTFSPSTAANSLFPSSMLHHGCLYAIDAFLVNSIWPHYLATFFNGTLIGKKQEDTSLVYQGPLDLQQIYDYGNVTLASLHSTFRNISDSMTTVIRQSGNENHSEPAIGTVIRDDTCLEVRWAWLTLPAVLVVSSILFFAIIITQTGKEQEKVWKSSSLALIFHGLEHPDGLQRRETLEGIRGMETAAARMTVRLDLVKGSTKFVVVEGEGRGNDEETTV